MGICLSVNALTGPGDLARGKILAIDQQLHILDVPVALGDPLVAERFIESMSRLLGGFGTEHHSR